MRFGPGMWQLDAGIPLVVSKRPDLASCVESYSILFHRLPVSRETKAGQESKVLNLLYSGLHSY